jgi:hypothetical protein
MRLADRLLLGDTRLSDRHPDPPANTAVSADTLAKYGIKSTDELADLSPARAREIRAKTVAAIRSENRKMDEATRKLRRVDSDFANLVEGLISECTVIRVDNLYQYMKTLGPIDVYDPPSFAPAFPKTFIEWTQADGRQIGVVVCYDEGICDPGDPPDCEPADNGYRPTDNGLWYSNYLPDREAWQQVRWVAKSYLFTTADNHTDPVVSLCASWQIAVGDRGRLIDLTYKAESPEQIEFLANTVKVVGYTMTFLGCRNVTTAYYDPPAGMQRKHRKKRGAEHPLVRYHVIQVGSPDDHATTRPGEGPMDLKALHPVRGHFCVDDQTEVLTRRGWMTHDALLSTDEVAGMDLATGRGRWVDLERVHRFKSEDDLVAVEKRGLSMRLTPNHRCLVGRRHSPDLPLEFVRAGDLGSHHTIPRAALWESDAFSRYPAIGSDMAALIGWVAAEGHISWDSVYLSQSPTANPGSVAKIDRLSKVLVIPDHVRDRPNIQRRVLQWARYDNDDKIVWRLPLGLSQAVMRLMPDKLLSFKMLRGMTQSEQRALLEAFAEGDGHYRGTALAIGQKYKVNLDVLQVIAVTLGSRTNLTIEQRSEPFYRLLINQGQRRLTLRGTDGRCGPPTTMVPNESGMVWCPQTPTGTWLARRRGIPFWTGNSHFGSCCDTHPPHGRLFGKYDAMVWVPDMVRGNPTAGVNIPSYEVG